LEALNIFSDPLEMGFMEGWLRRISLLCFLSCSLAGIPGVFDDYFDSDVRIVDVSQKLAFKACLSQPGPLIVKTNSATRKCLGDDNTFDWNDFSELNDGPDPNRNGLSNSMEDAELCFYKQMGWLDGTQVQKDTILNDFSGLSDDLKDDFIDSINNCVSWNGDFASSRRKRSASAEVDSEFSLLYNLRQKRQAGLPGPKNKMVPKGKVPKGKAPIGKAPIGKATIFRKGTSKNGTGKNVKGTVNNGKGTGQSGKAMKKKIPNPGPGPILRRQENPAYTKLWCVDLAIQKSLKSCVESVLSKA